MPRVLLLLVLCLLSLPAKGRAALPTIVCFGDSLTAGYHAPAGMAYPDFLQKDLDRAGYHYKVVNMGIAGNSSTDALGRVQRALALKPSIVVLEEGAVDGLRGVPVAVVKKNLTTMIREFQQAHVRVLLVGMQALPNLGPEYVTSFDELYPALAKQFHLRITPFMLRDVYFNKSLMSDDGIHPNAGGYKKIADALIYPALIPMLRK